MVSLYLLICNSNNPKFPFYSALLDSETDDLEDQISEVVPQKYKAPNPPIKRKQTKSTKQARAKKAQKATPATKSSTASTSKKSSSYTIPVEEKFPITDDRKPFVCQTCGVAFTRQKALESHARVSREFIHFNRKLGNIIMFCLNFSYTKMKPTIARYAAKLSTMRNQ